MPSADIRRFGHGTPALGPILAFTAALAITTAIGFGGFVHMHADYALPLAVAILFALAACVAALGWYTRGDKREGLTYWDAAGALLFIGIVLSAAVEPDQLVRIMKDGPA